MVLVYLLVRTRFGAPCAAAKRVCGDQNVAIEAVLANPAGVARMDNNTLLFQDKGSGRFKDIKIYPNRIEVLKKGTFGGKHTEIVYLKDITGVSRIKGRDVFLRNRLLTACVFSLSSRSQAQEFVNALNMVM